MASARVRVLCIGERDNDNDSVWASARTGDTGTCAGEHPFNVSQTTLPHIPLPTGRPLPAQNSSMKHPGAVWCGE